MNDNNDKLETLRKWYINSSPNVRDKIRQLAEALKEPEPATHDRLIDIRQKLYDRGKRR